ncbi:MAG: cytochrome c [Verrucomicrobiota bacterium]
MSNFSPFQSPDGTETDYSHKLNVSSTHAAAAREKGNLSMAKAPLSLWALLPICAVAVAAGGYLAGNAAWGPNLHGFNAVPSLPSGVDSAGAPPPEFDPKVWVAKGKAEYGTVCISCHLGNGEGQPGTIPPLKGSEWVLHGEERLISIILHGISGPLQVNGKTYNGAMPPQAGAKSDKIIGQIASYIRNEWGNTGSLIYDDQVKVVRAKLAARTAPFSEAQLKEISTEGNLPPTKRNAAPAEGAAPAAAGTPAPAPAAPAAAPAPAPAQ